MVLDASLFKTRHSKVEIKGKVDQSRERSCSPRQYRSVVTKEKGTFRSPTTMVAKNIYVVYTFMS